VGRQKQSVRARLGALTLAMLLVFGLDLFVPIPIGASILYIPLLLLAARISTARIVWIYCGASAMLVVVAMLIVPRWPIDNPVHIAVIRIVVAAICVVVTWLAINARQISITYRKSAEASFQSEREFRDLAENLPDVVARFDREMRHIYVNRAVQQYTGMPPESFLGKDHVELNMPPELVDLWQAKIQAAFETGKGQLLEFSFPEPGGVRHFECRLVPELAADGSVETVLGINRDITETVRAQERSEAHLAQLAHVSRLSTIGSLVSEIAHEVNQPLHAIANYAQACSAELNNLAIDRKSNLINWIKQIAEQAHRAAEIIRRSSRFARKGSVNRSKVDVNELIHECLRLNNFNLRAHHIKLRCDLAPSLPPIVADSIQVQQVLVNLLRNAIEAMSEIPEADRKLLVSSESIDGSLQISVRDNGIGISDEQAKRLFEPFFTTKEEGMGMGLPVSQAIVEAHSGRLWAEPNSDRGVTFFLTLPLAREELSHEYCHV
jgi:two-component system, LuxR family, sensor kinase FixL